MRFVANDVDAEDDGYATTLGFVDSPESPHNQVILQLQNNPEPQDMELGLDGVYIDIDGEIDAHDYDLVREISYGNRTVRIRMLTEDGVEVVVDIEIPADIETDRFLPALERMQAGIK